MPATSIGRRLALAALTGLLLSAAAVRAEPARPSQAAPPGAPANLRVASTATTEIRFAWEDNSVNEEGFALERAREGSTVFAQVAAVGPSVTTYTDAGLSPGVTYQYRVRAHNAGGLSAFSNVLTARTVVNWLVLIAVNDYKLWRPLRAPLNDVREVKRILTARYQFDDAHRIEVLNEDATLERIYNLFGELKKKVASQDTIVLFYAGHGVLDAVTNSGYWIPYDAGTKRGQGGGWLADTEVKGAILNLNAKHILLIADSCYSGNLLAQSRGAEETREATEERYRREYDSRSRVVLTSGNQEPVSDAAYGNQSAFAWHLIRKLEDNQQPYIDTEDLYYHIRRGVEGQQPLVGPLKDVGHETGGGYVFMLKGAKGFDLLPTDLAAPLVRAPAFVDPTPEIKNLLGRWKTCYETVDLGCLSEIWPGNKFRKDPAIKGYTIDIPQDSIAIVPGEQQATINCLIRITTIGRSRDRREYRGRFVLEKKAGAWRIVEHRPITD